MMTTTECPHHEMSKVVEKAKQPNLTKLTYYHFLFPQRVGRTRSVSANVSG